MAADNGLTNLQRYHWSASLNGRRQTEVNSVQILTKMMTNIIGLLYATHQPQRMWHKDNNVAVHHCVILGQFRHTGLILDYVFTLT